MAGLYRVQGPGARGWLFREATLKGSPYMAFREATLKGSPYM